MSKRKETDFAGFSSSMLLKSAYELAREENIKRNEEVLASLGLSSASSERVNIDILPTSKETKKKTEKKKQTTTPKEKKTPTRQSARIRGVKLSPKEVKKAVEKVASYEKRLESSSEERMRKYERLLERHAKEGLELPKTASYKHTVHRVHTMTEKALSNRVRAIERAAGTYAVIKMKQFAEVLILEGMEGVAAEADAALQRLLDLPKFKNKNWQQMIGLAKKQKN